MAANKFNKIQREQMMAKIAEMHLNGASQEEIGLHFGINQPTVSKYLAKLTERWQKSQLLSVDATKARILRKLEKLTRENYEGWNRSVGLKKQSVTGIKKALGPGGAIVDLGDHKTTTHEDAGDPRFLNNIKGLVELEMAITGVAKPVELKGNMTFEIKLPDDFPAADNQPQSA